MTQNIYTELVLKQPTEIFNILDQLEKFEDQHHYVELYANCSPYVFQIPLEENRELLSKLFLIDQYIDSHFEEKDKRELINGVESIDLSAFFNFLDNHFQITVKCDRDEDFIIYCDGDDWTKIYQLSNNLDSDYKRIDNNERINEGFKGITNEMLIEAAKKHAKDVLGDDQFKINKNAVKGIADDFINGAKFILTALEDSTGDLINLVDKDLEFETIK